MSDTTRGRERGNKSKEELERERKRGNKRERRGGTVRDSETTRGSERK